MLVFVNEKVYIFYNSILEIKFLEFYVFLWGVWIKGLGIGGGFGGLFKFLCL